MSNSRNRVAGAVRVGFRYLNATVLICGFAGMGFMLGAAYELRQVIPDATELGPYQPELTTEIYSTELQQDGTQEHTLLARLYEEYRKEVRLDDICTDLIEATIAIEDRRFYSHRGVSPRDILRAAWINITRQELAQGASTITQQLARNVWLTQERTWDRKLKELALALELEQRYSKDEILEMYLNEICYGHGAFGVKAAADLYYGKHPGDLQLHEAAMIAGMPRWPVGYSPYQHPDRCRSRRDAVLAAMETEGFITGEQRKQAAAIPIDRGLEPLQERGVVARHAPHFTHLVIRKLTERYGAETVYQGGLRVYTTLDLRVQKVAEKALTQQVKNLRRRGLMKKGVRGGQGAVTCVEVKTGRILAMVGGVGPYEKVQTNRAHPGPPGYGRQPGSSFKPYVWACALENGFSPKSRFSADPIKIGDWTPQNYSRSQKGPYTLRAALRDSVNLVSVRIVKKLSPHRVRRFAAKVLNIPVKRLVPYPSLALGVSNLSPLEQTVGYCAFANNGLRPTVRYWRRIEDHTGRTLVKARPQRVPVMRPTTAHSMLSMLRTVVRSGTGTRARRCGRPCGGKTGTTNDAEDVWFVGVTPQLSTAVWLGNEKPSRMPHATGGGWAAPVWVDVVKQASQILHNDGQFPTGRGVVGSRTTNYEENLRTITVCTETGRRATPYCPATKEKKIESDEEPPPLCEKHKAPASTSASSGGSRRSSSRRVITSARPSHESTRTPSYESTAGDGDTTTGHAPRNSETAQDTVSRPRGITFGDISGRTGGQNGDASDETATGETGAVSEPGSVLEELPAHENSPGDTPTTSSESKPSADASSASNSQPTGANADADTGNSSAPGKNEQSVADGAGAAGQSNSDDNQDDEEPVEAGG